MGCGSSASEDAAPREVAVQPDLLEAKRSEAISQEDVLVRIAAGFPNDPQDSSRDSAPSTPSKKSIEDDDAGPEMSASASLVSLPTFESVRSLMVGGTWSKKLSMRGMNSEAQFMHASQTIIIFDWDDTLCPTAFMGSSGLFDWKGQSTGALGGRCNAELKALSDRVIAVLTVAKSLGQVLLVTNAKRPWVEMSCASVLPDVAPHLLGIHKIYAMEYLRTGEGQKLKEMGYSTLTETKARAMHEAVTQFYSRYEQQSWKNIVSVGDALYEHDAIRAVILHRQQQVTEELGFCKPIRCKTVKFLDVPTVFSMVMELTLLARWLPNIVAAETNVDINLAASEDQITGWNRMFDPKDSTISAAPSSCTIPEDLIEEQVELRLENARQAARS